MVEPRLPVFWLAMQVARMIPVGIPTQDYIDSILRYRQSGENPATSTSSTQEAQASYVNAVQRWRDAYIQEHAGHEVTKNELSELQRENDRLRAELKESEPISNPSRKRKITECADTAIDEAPSLKRRSTEHPATAESDMFERLVTPLGAFLMVREERKTLLRRMYDLNKARNNNTRTSLKYPHHISFTACATGLCITRFCEEYSKRAAQRTDPLANQPTALETETEAFFQGIACAVRLLVDSVDELAPRNNPKHTPPQTGAAIYDVASLFRTVLSSLSSASHALAKAHLEHENQQTQQATAAPRTRNRTRSTLSHPTEPPPPKQPPILPAKLVQLLTHILVLLRRASPAVPNTATSPLLEALTYLLLTRAGQLLYQLTRHPAPGVYIHPLDATDAAPPLQEQALATRAAALEAKLLTPLLEAVVALAETESADTAGAPETLLQGARAQLQATLLRGVFGDSVAEDAAYAAWWGEGLRMPAAPEVRLDEDVADGEGDAFVEDLWRVCGWGILGRALEEVGGGGEVRLNVAAEMTD